MKGVMVANQPQRQHRRLSRGPLQMAGLGGVSLVLLLLMTACGMQIGPSAGTTGQSTGGTTVRVRVTRGPDNATLVLVPVMMNGQGPFTFALDTGASTSLIDRPLAVRLNLQQNGTPQAIAGVSGQELAIPVKVHNWSIGGKIRLPPATVSNANLFGSQRSAGLEGLIGSDIWSRFGKITLDYTAQTLTVYRQFAHVSGGLDERIVSRRASVGVSHREVGTRPTG